MPNHNANSQQTLWDRSIKTNSGCWEYAPTNPDGYGRFWYKNKVHPAHRLAYEFHTGNKIPKNMKVCHSCDNRCCINPEHLFLGTQKDNMDDMTKKGRDKRVGSKNGFSKLTEKDIPIIRKLRKSGLTLKSIAKEFKVGSDTIGLVISNKTWKHVPKGEE